MPLPPTGQPAPQAPVTLHIGRPPSGPPIPRIPPTQPSPSPSPRSPGLVLVIMAVVVLMAAAAASAIYAVQGQGKPPAHAQHAPDNIASTGHGPACADTFAAGRVFTTNSADFACTDPDGTRHVLAAFRCNDGQHLWSVDRSATGTTAGWGYTGKAWHAISGDDVAGDAGYGKAYTACQS